MQGPRFNSWSGNETPRTATQAQGIQTNVSLKREKRGGARVCGARSSNPEVPRGQALKENLEFKRLLLCDLGQGTTLS